MHRITHSIYQGIPGVYHIQGQRPGPTTAIIACVHGGEITGLSSIDYIVDYAKSHTIHGNIICILTHKTAYLHYHTLLKKGHSPIEALRKSRYINDNINRHATREYIQSENTAEAKRLRELEPIRKEVDYAIDIHSTTSPAPSMAIYIGTMHDQNIKKHIQSDQHIHGLTHHITGQSLLSYLHKSHNITGIAIETGYQLDPCADRIGQENTYSFLHFTNNIQNNYTPSINLENQDITVYDSIMFHNTSFTSPFLFENHIHHGDILPKGTHIAYDGKKERIIDRDSIILLPTNNIIHTGEEYCFLGEVNK